MKNCMLELLTITLRDLINPEFYINARRLVGVVVYCFCGDRADGGILSAGGQSALCGGNL